MRRRRTKLERITNVRKRRREVEPEMEIVH
jgi:hypothetical protein